MTTAPMNRDDQIQMMVGAKERHAARTARWAQDTSVVEVVRHVAEPKLENTASFLRHDERVARCG